MPHSHRAGRRNVSLWVGEDLLGRLAAEAQRRGLPRATLGECLFLEHFGLPPVQVSPFANKIRLFKKK